MFSIKYDQTEEDDICLECGCKMTLVSGRGKMGSFYHCYNCQISKD